MAVQALSAAAAANNPLTQATAQPLAGGTTLIDLMKLDVMRPAALVDINPLARELVGDRTRSDGNLRLGALAKMSEVAAHAEIQRNYPVIAEFPEARRQRPAAQHGDARRQRDAANALQLFPRCLL